VRLSISVKSTSGLGSFIALTCLELWNAASLGDDRAIYATFVSGPDDSIGSPKAFKFEKVMRTQVHSSAAA
jgi:hypothetical protein